ncbi:relaxase/mobilization nuclease domain-containing protein [Aerococcaceae bacterium NML191292]|nr:relaxase/mobilization nuclease domain-containing protein [Aerococcaceae bacterium NML191292]
MAIMQIKPIKIKPNNRFMESINYIINPEKTENGRLVSTNNCGTIHTDLEFEMNHILSGKSRDIFAHHMYIAYAPEDNLTADDVHKINTEIIKKHFGDEYQYVIATHTDKEHLHSHIIFNHVNSKTLKCYRSNKKTYNELQYIIKKTCEKYKLKLIEPNKDGVKRASVYKHRYRHLIRKTVDQLIKEAVDIDDFIDKLQENSFAVKRGKSISVKHISNGQTRYIRLDTLGNKYTNERISERINEEFVTYKWLEFKPFNDRLPKYVQRISKNKKVQQSPALRAWVGLHNIQSINQSMSRMNQLGIGNFNQLMTYLANMEKVMNEQNKSLLALNKDLKTLDTLKKSISIIPKLSAINEQFNSLNGTEKDRFYMENKTKLELFSHIIKDLNSYGIMDINVEDTSSLLNQIATAEDTLNRKIELEKKQIQWSKNTKKELKTIYHNYLNFIDNAETIIEFERDLSERTREKLNEEIALPDKEYDEQHKKRER